MLKMMGDQQAEMCVLTFEASETASLRSSLSKWKEVFQGKKLTFSLCFEYVHVQGRQTLFQCHYYHNN